MKKIGVFLGDLFWSSTPYDGVNLYHELSQNFETDLIVFKDDIRLNKRFQGYEKFKFNPDSFLVPNLKVVKNWRELKNASKDYSLIISQAKIAPKTRFPFPYQRKTSRKPHLACPLAVWDVGGCDILHDSVKFADYFFVKGPIWREWLIKMGYEEDQVFTTGSPHYDYFFDSDKNVVGSALSEKEFLDKYSLDKDKKKILLMPTNPSSHKEQFNKNFKQLDEMVNLCDQNNIELLVKTYPHDYVFFENEGPHTGIYKRRYTDKPQYQFMSEQFPSMTVIESQDHHAALRYSDKMFNMAGSHVAWETFYTKSVSYAIGYKDKKYYKQIPVLKHLDFISFPDDLMNIDAEKLSDIVHQDLQTQKTECNQYFLNEVSMTNITQAVKRIVMTND